jgi:N-methylhydantoinase A
MSFQRTIAMRYLGQWRSLSVEIPEGPVDMTALVARFHEEHEREFAYKREDGAAVEIYQLALRAVGITPKPELTRHEPEPDAALPDPVTRRPVHFDEEDDAVDTPVFDRDTLKAGTKLDGPAIVQQLDSTIVVPPGVTAEVDPQLIIRMTIAPEDLS